LMVSLYIFFVLDRVVHSMYIIVCALATDSFMPVWKRYKSKHNGRKKFQTHLGIALMNKGIELDWKDPFEEEDKPKWMPQKKKNGKYHPCDCGICFFCNIEMTNNICHGKVTARPIVFFVLEIMRR